MPPRDSFRARFSDVAPALHAPSPALAEGRGHDWLDLFALGLGRRHTGSCAKGLSLRSPALFYAVASHGCDVSRFGSDGRNTSLTWVFGPEAS